MADHDIAHRHIKNCRHTFTMTALDRNTHPELANTLGHANMQMVINHYAKGINNKALEVDDRVNMYKTEVGDTFSGTIGKYLK